MGMDLSLGLHREGVVTRAAIWSPRQGVTNFVMLRYTQHLCSSTQPLWPTAIYTGLVRVPRAMGARPGGWVGRGPAFTGGIGRVTAASTGKRISSP